MYCGVGTEYNNKPESERMSDSYVQQYGLVLVIEFEPKKQAPK